MTTEEQKNEQHIHCPRCGYDSSKHSLKPRSKFKLFFFTAILAAALFTYGWIVKDRLSGKKPNQEFAQVKASNPGQTHSSAGAPGPAHSGEIKDPEIVKLKETAQANPQVKEGWQILAVSLIQKIRASDKPEPELVFETIEALRNVLNIDPKDPDALIAMADLSFDQQAFSKAKEFYETYLEIEKEDYTARARYASTLGMLNQYDKAITELNYVLEKDPKNFNAHAYLAISYAQKGDFKQAREKGEQALQLAPSEEARARFSGFLEGMKEDEIKSSVAQTSSSGETGSTASPEAEKSPEGRVVNFIVNNPIAKPKFVSFAMQKDTQALELYFKDFPMQMMPPFAKDKFFSGIKAALGEDKSIKTIVFIDSVNGEKLDTFEIK